MGTIGREAGPWTLHRCSFSFHTQWWSWSLDSRGGAGVCFVWRTRPNRPSLRWRWKCAMVCRHGNTAALWVAFSSLSCGGVSSALLMNLLVIAAVSRSPVSCSLHSQLKCILSVSKGNLFFHGLCFFVRYYKNHYGVIAVWELNF